MDIEQAPCPLPFALPTLFDGATGTHMQAAGFPLGSCLETWILEHPKILQDLQRSYLDAGSDVLTAPTFGANCAALSAHGLSGEVEEINRALVALSREVAGDRPVCGDISPTGLYIEPFGDTPFETLVDIYSEQMAVLDRAGVDFFLVETTTTLFEARAAVLAGRTVSDKPIVVSFTCDEHGRCLSGADLLCALVTLQGMGISAFGVNCACSPEALLPHMRRIAPYARVPLLVQPNAGLPENKDGRFVYTLTPEQFCAFLPELWACGVRLFGGCCGTGPAHIGALRTALDALDKTTAGTPMRQEDDTFACANNKDAFFITPDIDVGGAIECSPELPEAIIDNEDQPHGAIKIMMIEDEDPDILAENQYLIGKPLCLAAHDPLLMERALRLFNGRAFFDNTTQLPPACLAQWASQYGLVCFS